MQVPIICEGDWWELWFVPAESEEAALLQEANRIVSERNSDGELAARVNPEGVRGAYTPNKSIVIQMQDGDRWKDDLVLIVPIYDSAE